MWTYWALFLIPALASVSPYRLDPGSRRIAYVFIAVLLIAVIGLRDRVGEDWSNYFTIYRRLEGLPFSEILREAEPGFAVVNWISSRFGWNIYGVNTISAAIFVAGLMAYSLRQPYVWRTLAMAVPIMVIILAMSAVRQAASLGLLMLAMNAFMDRKLRWFIFWTLLATLFHQTAAAFLLYGWFINGRLRISHLIVAGGAFVLIGVFILSDSVSYYTSSYLQGGAEAEGALPRLALNLMAAGIFLYFRKAWAANYRDAVLFRLMALTSLVLIVGVFAFPIAADRMGLYLLPFQIAVLARLPALVSRRDLRPLAAFGSLALYGLILFVWLNFSRFAERSWIPYDWILTGTPSI